MDPTLTNVPPAGAHAEKACGELEAEAQNTVSGIQDVLNWTEQGTWELNIKCAITYNLL